MRQADCSKASGQGIPASQTPDYNNVRGLPHARPPRIPRAPVSRPFFSTTTYAVSFLLIASDSELALCAVVSTIHHRWSPLKILTCSSTVPRQPAKLCQTTTPARFFRGHLWLVVRLCGDVGSYHEPLNKPSIDSQPQTTSTLSTTRRDNQVTRSPSCINAISQREFVLYSTSVSRLAALLSSAAVTIKAVEQFNFFVLCCKLSNTSSPGSSKYPRTGLSVVLKAHAASRIPISLVSLCLEPSSSGGEISIRR